MRVRSIPGDFREEGYLNNEDLEDEEFTRELNQSWRHLGSISREQKILFHKYTIFQAAS